MLTQRRQVDAPRTCICAAESNYVAGVHSALNATLSSMKILQGGNQTRETESIRSTHLMIPVNCVRRSTRERTYATDAVCHTFEYKNQARCAAAIR